MKAEVLIHDFDLKQDIKDIFNSNLNDLLDVAPSDSSATSNITKTLSGYLCKLQVISSEGKFIVSSTGHDLEELFKSLFAQIHRQVTQWRDQRFTN